MTKITGGCHCGNIRYEFSPSIGFDELPLRICKCSFCSKQGNRYTSDPDGHLLVTIERGDDIAEYQFASKTTDSLFCTICGVMPLMKLQLGEQTFAIINVNTSDQLFDMSKAQYFDYSSETVEQSIVRRKQKWISNVEISIQSKRKAGLLGGLLPELSRKARKAGKAGGFSRKSKGLNRLRPESQMVQAPVFGLDIHG